MLFDNFESCLIADEFPLTIFFLSVNLIARRSEGGSTGGALGDMPEDESKFNIGNAKC